MTKQDYYSLKEDIHNLKYVGDCVNTLQDITRTYAFLRGYTLEDAIEWLIEHHAKKEIELQEKLGVVGDNERTVRIVSPELLKQWEETLDRMNAVIELSHE